MDGRADTDNYIVKEGDVLAYHDGRRSLVVRQITKSHITYVVRGGGRARTVTRGRFRYALWYGDLFLLERA